MGFDSPVTFTDFLHTLTWWSIRGGCGLAKPHPSLRAGSVWLVKLEFAAAAATVCRSSGDLLSFSPDRDGESVFL